MSKLVELERYAKKYIKPLSDTNAEYTDLDLELENTYGFSPRIADMMVGELIMDDVPHDVAVKCVAMYLECDESLMKVLMPIHGSYNPVVGYVDGVLMKRCTLHKHMRTTIRKIQDIAWELYKISRNELVLILMNEYDIPESTIRDALLIKQEGGLHIRRSPEHVKSSVLKEMLKSTKLSRNTRLLITDKLEARINGK